jgi:hypothetical protein
MPLSEGFIVLSDGGKLLMIEGLILEDGTTPLIDGFILTDSTLLDEG